MNLIVICDYDEKPKLVGKCCFKSLSLNMYGLVGREG